MAATGTIHALPNELLMHMFSLACPPIDFSKRSFCESEGDEFSDKHDLHYRYLPLILSGVCRHWRELAFHSHEIWSTYALEVNVGKLDSQVSLLRLYLTNSGPLTFALDLDMRFHWTILDGNHPGYLTPSIQWTQMRPLADLIFREFSEKIQILRLAAAPPGWMSFISEERLPQLQDLLFAREDRMDYTVLLDLEEAVYNAHRLTTPALPPLTIIHLRNVSIDICVDILFLCSHLTEYHCYNPMDPPDMNSLDDFDLASPQPLRVNNPFSLPNLKDFGWTPYMGGEQNSTLLNNINLPNLEELVWCGSEHSGTTNEEKATMLLFFSKLPKTLHSITYRQYAQHFRGSLSEFSQYHSQLLSHSPHAKSLVFHQCTATFIGSIFHLLSDCTHNTEYSFLLPQLNKIVVHRYTNDGGDFGIPLVQVLGERRSVFQIPSFRFELVKSPIIWSDNVQGQLRRLQDEFDLTVTEGHLVSLS